MIVSTKVILIIILVYYYLPAQQTSDESWNKIISLQFGFQMGNNTWEYAHPFYNGTGGTQTIRETGSFKLKSIFNGEFELSHGYFGFSASAGIFSAEIKVDKVEEPYDFNSIFIEIAGKLFPLGNTSDRVVPFLIIGGGALKSSGDLDNSGLFLSFGGGFRTFFTENLGASLMLKGYYLTFNEIPLDENVTGDISVFPFAIAVGVSYKF